jgi:hypothetical protein
MAQVRTADVTSVGIEGLRDDDLAFARAWGFLVRPDRSAVSISQGGEDLMVPPAHDRRLGAHVPGARMHVVQTKLACCCSTASMQYPTG